MYPNEVKNVEIVEFRGNAKSLIMNKAIPVLKLRIWVEEVYI